ncbi:unnamed protein product [Paramecium octaurelia]|uniref:Uncharacterized protein n=1 Tax=Paramecium octaurelia TaxID=43137 RepID=A0A8S1Y8F3_PAROT|nr:unnamed protein product [Paramecium octaurelia]
MIKRIISNDFGKSISYSLIVAFLMREDIRSINMKLHKQ